MDKTPGDHQPRWPRGTPVAPGGKGPGGGRYRGRFRGVGPLGTAGWDFLSAGVGADDWVEREFGRDSDPTGRHGSVDFQVLRPAKMGEDGPAVFRRLSYADPYLPVEMGSAPIQHLYRAMSLDEWDEAAARGYIQSDMRGVLAPWEGTNAEVSPRAAMFYLPRGEPAVVVKLRVEAEDRWFTRAEDDYVRTRGRVPLDRVEHVSAPLAKDSRGALYYWMGEGEARDGDWADGLARRLPDGGGLGLRRADGGYRPVWWDDVRVGGHGVEERHVPTQGDYLAEWDAYQYGAEQMQSPGLTAQQHHALLAWQHETQIPDLLQAALRDGRELGPVEYDAGIATDPDTGRPIVDVTMRGTTRHSELRRVRGAVDLARLADDLRGAIARGELTADAELWRGITLEPGEVGRWRVGDVVTERGFLATSMSREHAEGMLGLRMNESHDSQPYLLRVLAPAGTHVAPGAGAVSELLLRDGHQMRVVSIDPPTEDEWGGMPGVITVELEPEGRYAA